MDTEQQADQAFLEERDQKVAPRFVQYMDILSLSLMSVYMVEEATPDHITKRQSLQI